MQRNFLTPHPALGVGKPTSVMTAEKPWAKAIHVATADARNAASRLAVTIKKERVYMSETKISSAQLKRLQVLWGQYASHEMTKYSRADRLIWASEQTKRTILSFTDLTLSEASDLINLLQAELG